MTEAQTNNGGAWLRSDETHCRRNGTFAPSEPWRIVLLGAPGSGKGTQGDLLGSRIHACHLSTGDLFRSAAGESAARLGPAMSQALEHMKKGELVADALVLSVVKERGRCIHCGGGFVLDGFPRSVPQAEALEAMLGEHGQSLDVVFNYMLPVGVLVDRLGGRRVCPQCKATYHLTKHPPRRRDICDACGSRLVTRDDDKPSAIAERMHEYARTSAPLIDFYAKRGILVRVPADGTPDEIYDRAWSLARELNPPLRRLSGR